MISPRRHYVLLALAVIAAGVLSRVLHTGVALLDKYLGDALYAVLVYLLLRAALPGRASHAAALASLVLMILIEGFQLTGVPAAMARSGNLLLRAAAIALGTGFHWYDLLAYAVGIALIACADHALSARRPAT